MCRDRGEMRNLAVEHKYQETLNKHRKLLYEWMNYHHVKQIRTEVHLIPGF